MERANAQQLPAEVRRFGREEGVVDVIKRLALSLGQLGWNRSGPKRARLVRKLQEYLSSTLDPAVAAEIDVFRAQRIPSSSFSP